jgi:hypothetical protein
MKITPFAPAAMPQIPAVALKPAPSRTVYPGKSDAPPARVHTLRVARSTTRSQGPLLASSPKKSKLPRTVSEEGDFNNATPGAPLVIKCPHCPSMPATFVGVLIPRVHDKIVVPLLPLV